MFRISTEFKPGIVLILSIVFSLSLSAQTGIFKGNIITDGEPVFGATVGFAELGLGTVSEESGNFEIKNIPEGTHLIKISFLGYSTIQEKVTIEADKVHSQTFTLYPDYLQLNETVVTGSRKEVPMYNAPVIISRIDSRILSSTQSLSLSEGLNFSPGLRLENNCQNCGFTQLRMNGLNGPYTQILVNSRPIFSALTGVYGLDMIPANMIDRVEVVRGGGSALYGGNAIAGIVNILTKQPIRNSFEAGINYGFTDLQEPDRTITANGSIVSETLDKGVSLYAYNRDRQPWDKDGDGFTEMTQLRNTTFGMDAFIRPSETNLLQINVFNINEFRRGGENKDIPPHQTALAEQLEHNIIGGSLSFEQATSNLKHKISIYTSAQSTKRGSYYGAGGRILTDSDTLTPEDIIALNAYGNSKGLSLVGGLQYSYDIHEMVMLMAGTEVQYNRVEDQMPRYNRLTDQKVLVSGNYTQLEITPTEKISMVVGGRLDIVRIDGFYGLDITSFRQKKTLQSFVPRASLMYQPHQHLKIRASFAQGYRAPQSFDEDLHIETVGGSARFIRLSEDLKTERSNSLNASINYSKVSGKIQINIVLEGFYTNLSNPFITADQEELPGGVIAFTKRNGNGASVQGLNAELNMAIAAKFNFQTGATFQTARYKQPELIWEPENPEDGETLSTRNIIRTPNLYGFFTMNYNPVEAFKASLSGVITGKMDVPHVIHPETGLTVMKQSNPFLELNIRCSYHIDIKGDTHFELIGGVQNIFNSFQKDFDRGPERDASYVYGPSRPRTIFVGLKFGLH